MAKTLGNKVTEGFIESRIVKTGFIVADTTTICFVHLDNGWQAIGTSSCVDPANFDRKMGERLARMKAIESLWAPFGMVLAEKLHNEKLQAQAKTQSQQDVADDGEPFSFTNPVQISQQDRYILAQIANGSAMTGVVLPSFIRDFINKAIKDI